jgi:ADP-glucose pyrophosphorylase
VLILSGDQLYRMNFRHIIAQHQEKDADITIATIPVNAEDATVIKNNTSVVTYQMPPYGSVILFASTKENAGNFTSSLSSLVMEKTTEIKSLNEWNVTADSVEIKDTSLFDWKTNDQLKFSSAEGVYTSTFE